MFILRLSGSARANKNQPCRTARASEAVCQNIRAQRSENKRGKGGGEKAEKETRSSNTSPGTLSRKLITRYIARPTKSFSCWQSVKRKSTGNTLKKKSPSGTPSSSMRRPTTFFHALDASLHFLCFLCSGEKYNQSDGNLLGSRSISSKPEYSCFARFRMRNQFAW